MTKSKPSRNGSKTVPRKPSCLSAILAALWVSLASIAGPGSFPATGARAADAAGAPLADDATSDRGSAPALTMGPRDVSGPDRSGEHSESGSASLTPPGAPGIAEVPSRAGLSLNPLPPLPDSRRNSIRRVNPDGNRKVVALTFDLCETGKGTSGYDAGIVRYLRTNGVKATFFAGGKWMQDHQEPTMQLMADPLFEIGNHSWTHRNFRQLTRSQMEDQVQRTQDQYRILRGVLEAGSRVRGPGTREMDVIPQEPVLFRFPYGTCNAEALGFLASRGLAAIQWDVVTADASPTQTAGAIARIVLSRVKPGSIIICHANGRGHGTRDALPLFVPKLREMGYDFLTIGELLDSGPAVTSKECYEERPGDNLKYDRITGVGKHANR